MRILLIITHYEEEVVNGGANGFQPLYEVFQIWAGTEVMEGRLIELDGFCWHGLEESGPMALIYEARYALPLCIRYYSLVRLRRGEELKWFFCYVVVVCWR